MTFVYFSPNNKNAVNNFYIRLILKKCDLKITTISNDSYIRDDLMLLRSSVECVCVRTLGQLNRYLIIGGISK
uniref:Uncharacterized protein n=1 Tax=Pararge aegeria TaxID=116150 RepID=S4P7R3_9NEOP